MSGIMTGQLVLLSLFVILFAISHDLSAQVIATPDELSTEISQNSNLTYELRVDIPTINIITEAIRTTTEYDTPMIDNVSTESIVTTSFPRFESIMNDTISLETVSTQNSSSSSTTMDSDPLQPPTTEISTSSSTTTSSNPTTTSAPPLLQDTSSPITQNSVYLTTISPMSTTFTTLKVPKFKPKLKSTPENSRSFAGKIKYKPKKVSTTSTPIPSMSQMEFDENNVNPSTEAKWKDFEESLKFGVDGVIKRMLPNILKLGSSGANFTGQCAADFLKFVFAMRQLKGWAMRMVDSAGRPQAGIFYGAITDFGDYDECLDIQATDSAAHEDNKELFVGKYCSVLMQPALPAKPMIFHRDSNVVNYGEDDTILGEVTSTAHFFYHLRLRLGICVPSSCVPHDVQLVMQEVWKPLGLKVQVNHCEIKRNYIPNTAQISCLVVIGTVVFFVLIGTAVDIIKRFYSTPIGLVTKPNKMIQVAKALSIYTNGKKLLSTANGERNMGCLHGMRFISMTWIILGHTYSFFHLSAYRDIKNLRDAPESISFMAVLNGWVDVDTFFFLGGMALSYSILKKANGRKTFSVAYYLFHRYWRLTPALGITIALFNLTPLISSGPLWHDAVDIEIEKCQHSWWRNLLYISNWFPLNELCMQSTWYLSADFQLYLLALIILLPLLRWPSIGLLLNFVFMIISGVIIAVITMVKDYAPSMTHVAPDASTIERMAVDIHWKPYTHLGPYCVGIAMGYLVYKQRKIRIKPVLCIFGWLSAAACSLAVVYGAYDWNNGRIPNDMVTALYASCHRIAWAMCMAWVSFACIYGQGGFINSFLSWSLWVPLSRLTYFMYLIHPVVMLVRVGSVRETHFFGHYAMAYFFVSHTMFTIGAAFVGSLLFEWPFAGLEKVFMPRGSTFKESECDLTRSTSVKQVIDDYSQYFGAEKGHPLNPPMGNNNRPNRPDMSKL